MQKVILSNDEADFLRQIIGERMEPGDEGLVLLYELLGNEGFIELEINDYA